MFLLYMAAINTDPFTNGSISTIIDIDGMAYYILSPGISLFKATKNSDTLDLRRGRLSFFGVHNMDRDYIASYENEYGIIFAFETMRPYKLLALDHPATKEALYKRAPENIKRILRRNYGYTMSGRRDSELDSDLTLSQYLCDEGYEGYATNFMPTDTGEFHPEFMICHVDGMRSLGRITNDPRRIANFLDEGRRSKVSGDLKVSRKGKQRTESPYVARARPTTLFESSSSPGASYGSPSARSSSKKLTFDDMDTDDQENIPHNLFRSGLFDDDSDNDGNREYKGKGGGLRKRKRRSYKKRKTRTNKRKRSKISAKKGTRRRR